MSDHHNVAELSQSSLLPNHHDLGDVSGIQDLFDRGNSFIQPYLSPTKPRVYIISGPSGVGKDTVLEQLREAHPHARYVVTATSRPRRPEEVDGVHYVFIDRASFEEQIARGDFIESALVYDNLYGVPRRPIEGGLAAGQDVVIKVDVKGAHTIRTLIPDTLSIFLLPESMESLLTRLRDRKTEDPDVLLRRFRTACEELERLNEFDYVVLNQAGKLDLALKSIQDIIEAEGRRVLAPTSRSRNAPVTT